MPKTVKFYYYELFFKDFKDRKLECTKIIEKLDFNKDIKIKKTRNYTLIVEPTINKCYFGRILRTRLHSDFFSKNKDGTKNLAEVTGQPKSEAGLIEYDIVNFAFFVKDYSLVMLMEQGFQYPGVGVFIEYLLELIKDLLKDNEFLTNLGLTDEENKIRITHKLLVKPEKIEKLKKVFDKKLKSVKMHFKKKADLPEDAPIEDFLKALSSVNDYTLDVEFRLRKTEKSKIALVKEFLSNFFGLGNKPDEIETLLQIPFPDLLNSFIIEVFDGETFEETNILKEFESEELMIDKDNIQDYEFIKKKLCSEVTSKAKELDEQ